MRPVPVVVTVTLLALVGPAARANAQGSNAAKRLADRYAPIVVVRNQSGPCDRDGEAYRPVPVEAVLGKPETHSSTTMASRCSRVRPRRISWARGPRPRSICRATRVTRDAASSRTSSASAPVSRTSPTPTSRATPPGRGSWSCSTGSSGTSTTTSTPTRATGSSSNSSSMSAPRTLRSPPSRWKPGTRSTPWGAGRMDRRKAPALRGPSSRLRGRRLTRQLLLVRAVPRPQRRPGVRVR